MDLYNYGALKFVAACKRARFIQVPINAADPEIVDAVGVLLLCFGFHSAMWNRKNACSYITCMYACVSCIAIIIFCRFYRPCSGYYCKFSAWPLYPHSYALQANVKVKNSLVQGRRETHALLGGGGEPSPSDPRYVFALRTAQSHRPINTGQIGSIAASVPLPVSTP